MYAYIKGKATYMEDDFVFLESNGMGYRVFFSARHLSMIELEKEITVYTYTSVREDNIILYGFFSAGEVSLYRKLLTVSGIGPKVGLNVMNLGNPENIIEYIATENMTELTKISGIGKKTASRLVLELKDKFDYRPGSIAYATGSTDALEALLSLGYSKEEALSALSNVPEDTPTGDAISLALKEMVRNR